MQGSHQAVRDSIELATNVGQDNVMMRAPRQTWSDRDRFVKVAAPLLMISSGLMLLFEVLALGFRREHPVYGSGIWVGLPTVCYAGLLTASLGRSSSRPWTVGLTVVGTALLVVLAAGLGIAGCELANNARLRLALSLQRNRSACNSCAELVMAKCGVQIAAYLACATLVCTDVYMICSSGRGSGRSRRQWKEQSPTEIRSTPDTEILLSGGVGDRGPKSFGISVPTAAAEPTKQQQQQRPPERLD